MQFGVASARRGWLTPTSANTRPSTSSNACGRGVASREAPLVLLGEGWVRASSQRSETPYPLGPSPENRYSRLTRVDSG